MTCHRFKAPGSSMFLMVATIDQVILGELWCRVSGHRAAEQKHCHNAPQPDLPTAQTFVKMIEERMKTPVPKRTNEDLKHYPITNIVNGWFFRIDEISQGYYRVEGIDVLGHSVSRDGIDPDRLLNECRADILKMFPDV